MTAMAMTHSNSLSSRINATMTLSASLPLSAESGFQSRIGLGHAPGIVERFLRETYTERVIPA